MTLYEYRDGRFWRDGSPFYLIAADYQYYRERREHWEDRLEKLRQADVNCITFYIPWRHHLVLEDGRIEFDFTGRTKDSRDVVGFMRRVQEAGLLMIAKPGPFVHSELNVGGLPDLVCPSFNAELPPARRHHGGPVTWCYDASQLPSPWEPEFDALALQWLSAVRAVLLPFVQPAGTVIALQLNDETVYCTSNDPPWNIGYEPSGIRRFHRLLADRYGTLEAYNRLHATAYPAWELVPPPRLAGACGPVAGAIIPAVSRREDVLAFIDWAEYQWRYRRDLYAQYARYLDLPLPYLTNFAGITPPIEENIPDRDLTVQERIPPDYAPLYPEWWFAMNRVESDADVHHYGMISWLGVAAYDRDVFDRYINTARRARGINMEENWGFGMLYDAKSKFPLVPFYQTLVSVAGGATGYDIYCGVSTDYWDDALDRVTKKQCPTFPSDAPIDEHGRCRPMYDTARLLNAWFAAHGAALLQCDLATDVGYLLYAPYAAVSSWVPDERYWQVAGHAIPRCGYQGFEPFSRALQRAGYAFAMFELDAARDEQWTRCQALAIHAAFFMDADAQQRLADHISRGGRLLVSGELPTVDLQWRPCTLFRDAVQTAVAAANPRVAYRPENWFTDPQLADQVMQLGVLPNMQHSDDLRAYLHANERDRFVFFFACEPAGPEGSWIELDGRRLVLQLGPKTCGVVRIQENRIVSCLVKATNEVEQTRTTVTLRWADQIIQDSGDFCQ